VTAPIRPPARTLAATAIIGVAVFGLAAAGAAGGRVGPTEEAAFRWVNGWPDALEPALWIFQLAGVLVVPLVLAGVAWWSGRHRLAWVLAAIVPAKLVVEHLLIKQVIDRQRPGTTICHLDASCAAFRGVPLDGPSFVSGHAVIAWAVATVLWWSLPSSWRWVPVTVALANSVARVYLGAHNPLDVVGGAGIGLAIGSLLLLALDRSPNAAIDHHDHEARTADPGTSDASERLVAEGRRDPA